MTIMFRRSLSFGNCSSPSSLRNFWMVVKTTPPVLTLSSSRRRARDVA